jgi:hypothetical protein
VASERILGAYSGGAVLDFHQLPNYSARVLLKAISDYHPVLKSTGGRF